MPILTAVPAPALRDEPWANGAGRTTVLEAGPDPLNWRWRLSIATVDQPCAFSALPGVRRWLAPLDGGIELSFPDGRILRAPRLGVLEFAGDPAPTCTLPDGPTRDFNLMLRSEQTARLLARPLVGTMVLLPEAAVRWFVHVVAGSARLTTEGETLDIAQGRSAWVEAGAARGRIALDGAGEVVLVRLAPP